MCVCVYVVNCRLYPSLIDFGALCHCCGRDNHCISVTEVMEYGSTVCVYRWFKEQCGQSVVIWGILHFPVWIIGWLVIVTGLLFQSLITASKVVYFNGRCAHTWWIRTNIPHWLEKEGGGEKEREREREREEKEREGGREGGGEGERLQVKMLLWRCLFRFRVRFCSVSIILQGSKDRSNCQLLVFRGAICSVSNCPLFRVQGEIFAELPSV